MKSHISAGLASASLFLISATASAQTATDQGASDAGFELEEIVVTARRKDESLQDVPTAINAVSGADIEKLNIRKFEDIASVVPGLVMNTTPSGTTATASVRGVNYEVNASGNNGTIEFYQNDAPISAGNLFQIVYDVQQVELLRGPQGTLRGRASPSGSMTVTTRRPDLQEMGGYVSAIGNNIGGYNGQGAVSFPIISDMLAIRVAGAYEENENNRVHSLNNPADPYSRTKSGRATIRFEPTDSLSFILTAQKTNQKSLFFDLMESQQVVFPNNAVNRYSTGQTTTSAFIPSVVPPFFTAGQRLSMTDTPRTVDLDYNNYNFQAQWAFAGQKLNYVGARNEQHLVSFQPGDFGDYFGPGSLAVYQGFGQPTDSRANATAHELRLSNEVRIADMFDYIFGAFTQKLNSPTDLVSQTPVANPTGTPTNYISFTDIQRRGGNKEESVFANLTAHIGDALEVSGGARYIKYHATGDLLQRNSQGVFVPSPDAHEDSKWNTTIYSASVKYNFTDNFMAYFSTGSSWRPGISAVGDFSLDRSDLENSFLILPPEESTSYEVGFKSTMLDRRLRTNVSVFHQKFDNYPYRSPGGVWFIETFLNRAINPPTGAQDLRPAIFNFVANVPVEVNGIEAQVDFSATSNWDMGISAAYSKGEIKDGVIPCTDIDNDGVPDAPGPNPTLLQLQNSVGGVGTGGTQGDIGTISGCRVNQNSSSAPQWSSVVQSEYRLPINDAFSSFFRGQASIYGNSKNDPLNPVDDVKRYALLNLYLGLRDPDGIWEVSLYGKNVTDTERVLSRSSRVLSTRLNSGFQATNFLGSDNTGGMTITAPREVGLSVRYAFGSK